MIVMALSVCPECRKGTLGWTTVREDDRPVDQLKCDRCGYVLAIEDWHIPLSPVRDGRCRNCGGVRYQGSCLDCGLSEEEDLEVHEELRSLVHPTADRLACARLAMAMGRRLIALKLATAAAHDGPQPSVARALRINLLKQIGETRAAMSDARQWTVESPSEPVAWAAFADQLITMDRRGEAIAALQKALELDPEAHRVRARLAQLYLDLERWGQAQAEARKVLAQKGDREATLAALEVIARYVELLIRRREVKAVEDALKQLGPRARRHPTFLCASAWLAWRNENDSLARRELKLARKLQANHPLLQDMENLVKGRRWWW
jgi:tetratricopeptide (TPR) repeat protein/uncharacterized protein YbaR (Trm112 family)